MSLLLTYLLFKYATFSTIGQQLNLAVDSTCLLYNGDFGICKRVDLCASAKEMLMKHQRPIICSFEGNPPFIPVVCCVPEKDLPFDPALISFGVTNPTTEVTNPTTKVTNPTTEDQTESDRIVSDQNVDASIRIDGQKSTEKCREYNDLLYENPKSTLTTTTTTMAPYKQNLINGHKFITGGIDAKPREFPHIALLGYGEPGDIHWLCGGGLISETFVITAAHCLSSELYGAVKVVRLGDLDILSNTDDAYPIEYQVGELFEYPEYSSDSKYHDIALVRLKSTVNFNVYTKPACLHVQRELPKDPFIAAGWGRVYFGGTHPSNLQRVDLNITNFQSCSRTYSRQTHGLDNGINLDIQICAEGATEGGDTCQGDSGAPIQYIDPGFAPNLYQIVGITSFGINCGIAPAIYTRVSFYIRWIEGIVWP